MRSRLFKGCVSPLTPRARISPIITPPPQRFYAFQATGGPVFEVFNRKTKWLQKERIAANAELSRQADYLKDEVAGRLCERLLVSAKKSCSRPLL